MARFVLGSVAERVLRHATCPVLTVPPGAPDAVPIGSSLYARILVAVDFSPWSRMALATAASLAHALNARMKVVHVVEPTPPYASMGVPDLDPRSAQELARAQLHALVVDAVHGDVDVREVVPRGAPAEQILGIAREERIDVIVTGVHGRNAADLMFFGSTTNRLVREAMCPVLTVGSDAARAGQAASTPVTPA